MKQITLTIREFYLFKEIAQFMYQWSRSENIIVIQADAHMLEELGY
jgi:hypothetical protein